MRPHAHRYIDGAQAFRVAARIQSTPIDAWIFPTYRRWIALGLVITAGLLMLATWGGW